MSLQLEIIRVCESEHTPDIYKTLGFGQLGFGKIKAYFGCYLVKRGKFYYLDASDDAVRKDFQRFISKLAIKYPVFVKVEAS